MEIEKVLTLYRELAKCEEKLAALRVVTIPAARADTPPIQRTSQPTERIAVDILALEEEKTRLLAEINETKAGLALQILDTVTNPAIAQILIRRYVRRKTFKQIAAEMKYCLRHVFKLHEKGKQEYELAIRAYN